MNATELSLVVAIVVGLAGMAGGYAIGFRRGQAVGWLDHYFKTVAEDRARRERNGRFKSRIAIRASGETSAQQEIKLP